MTDYGTLASEPLFGLPLPELWFGLLFAILAAFLALDGFDFGAGVVFATRDDETERETILTAIGPFWDGNEVWLVVFGGALFAAFPGAYAGLFGRNYLLMFGILAALILRGLAPEMYEQRHDEQWQRWWGRAFVVGSVGAPLLLGVFVGSWITGSGAVVTVQGVTAGLALVALSTALGVAFLRTKTTGRLHDEIRRLGEVAVVGYLLAVVATLAASWLAAPRLAAAIATVPVAVLVVASIILAGVYVVALRRDQNLVALVAAGVATFGLSAVVGLLLFPLIDPAAGLTVEEGIVSMLQLNIMSVAAALLLPLVVTYFAVLYSSFRGPVRTSDSY
jgi:cytochrome d ubiquinol oxidase subunit II